MLTLKDVTGLMIFLVFDHLIAKSSVFYGFLSTIIVAIDKIQWFSILMPYMSNSFIQRWKLCIVLLFNSN